MKWVKGFDFFLFDFDGLLVDTEALHFEAYRTMLKRRGYDLTWSFGQYCLEAQRESNRLREVIYSIFPKLYIDQPRWEVLKEEKQKIYQDLVVAGRIILMPGVEKLLHQLEELAIPRCVVTNSLREQTLLIREKCPLLSTIPHWVTREEYSQAKPSPEGYNKAIALYGKGMHKMIGFEDTARGIWSLQQTTALPVLVTKTMDSELKSAIGGEFLFYPSFEDISEESLL